MSVAIGYVHGEMVHARFMDSLRAAEKNAIVLDEWSGPDVVDARNRLVLRFLDSGCEWLYMCDTDTVFESNTISRLLARDKKIISALVYVDGSPPFPMMYKRIADIAMGTGMFMVVQDWDRRGDTLLKVDGVGAGCLLVHRDVYLEIEKRYPNPVSRCEWFSQTYVGPMRAGEDLSFCMRAAECGFEIHVDTTVRVGHMKVRMI